MFLRKSNGIAGGAGPIKCGEVGKDKCRENVRASDQTQRSSTAPKILNKKHLKPCENLSKRN